MSTSTSKVPNTCGRTVYCGPLTRLSCRLLRQHVMSDENQRSPDHHENRESLKRPCEGRPHTDTHIPLFSSDMYVHTCSCMERIFFRAGRTIDNDTHIVTYHCSDMYVHTCSCMERIFGLIFEQPAHLQPHRRRRPPVLLGRWTVEG